jgi:uncharacterized protein
MADYSLIDNSPLLMYLFYPRRDYRKPTGGAFDLAVAVAPEVLISCRAYPGHRDNPWLLFFHGNGEVVGDYDGIAPLYHRVGLNLCVADYRGYGASTGKPGFDALVKDAHAIFKAAGEALQAGGYRPELWVMGRSLGSISALELAFHYPESIKGFIIESGFISVVKLIDHLGLPSPGDLSVLEQEYQQRAGAITVPALILHGEHDSLVPLEQGRELFDSLGSPKKELVVIPEADHNDIMFVGLEDYLGAIGKFIAQTR